MMPKRYEDRFGNFPQHKGKPKISYSQLVSWEDYRDDYIRNYFFGIREDSGPYAKFGSACGEYLEHRGLQKDYNNELLSQKDKVILNKVDLSGECTYEEEIVIDYGDFVLEGYLDKATYNGNKVKVLDFKTGSIKKKASFYGSDDYLQTTAYCKYLADKGYEIEASEVLILDRAGNAFRGERLYLTGDVSTIKTEYTEERVNLLEQRLRNAVKEISELYNTYKNIT